MRNQLLLVFITSLDSEWVFHINTQAVLMKGRSLSTANKKSAYSLAGPVHFIRFQLFALLMLTPMWAGS